MEQVIRQTSIKLAQVGEALGIRNLDPDAGLIFVTGEGVIGHRVALKLLKAGFPEVRLAAHKEENIEELKEMGAETVDFAWEREETYEKSLKGVKTVLCTVPYTELWHMHFPAFLKACEHAGVRHFCKISFYHARLQGDQFQNVPLVKQHGICDDLLIKELSPQVDSTVQADTEVSIDFSTPHMGYTIIYASHFMSTPLFFQGKAIRENKQTPIPYYGASGNRGVNYVSPNDVADCAVRVILNPREHYNKEYTLTGPEAITEQQVAGFLSKHLDKPIMYVEQPVHELKSEHHVNVAEWMLRDMIALEAIKATGKEEDSNFITNDVEKITERKPQTFEEYLADSEWMTKMEAGANPLICV
jgi:uncharacterized protein YbjT (DUF2867 family)